MWWSQGEWHNNIWYHIDTLKTRHIILPQDPIVGDFEYNKVTSVPLQLDFSQIRKPCI